MWVKWPKLLGYINRGGWVIKLIKLFINPNLTNSRIGAHRAYMQIEYILYHRICLFVLHSACNLITEICWLEEWQREWTYVLVQGKISILRYFSYLEASSVILILKINYWNNILQSLLYGMLNLPKKNWFKSSLPPQKVPIM